MAHRVLASGSAEGKTSRFSFARTKQEECFVTDFFFETIKEIVNASALYEIWYII